MASYSHLEEGDFLSITLDTGETATAHVPFVRGNIIGFPKESGTEGDSITLSLEGVKRIDKTTGTAWTQGQRIYWNASTAKGITTDESGLFIGTAWVAAASGDDTGEILLARPQQSQISHSVQTLASGTVTVTDARVAATSTIHATWKTTTGTKTTPLLAVPGSGSYTISAIAVAGTTADTACAGTVMVTIFY